MTAEHFAKLDEAGKLGAIFGPSKTADPALVIGVAQPYRHGFWIVPDLLRDYWHFWSGFVIRRTN